MREPGQGAFRESADEDPHGTRAIAMRLTPAGRELLSRPAGPLWPLVVSFGGLATMLVLSVSIESGVAMGLLAVMSVAWAIGERTSPRLQIDHEGLTIHRAWGEAKRHRWRDVQRFTLGQNAARVSVGDGSQTFEARAVRGPHEAWLGLDQAVTNADLLIESGAHRAGLTCGAFIIVSFLFWLAGWSALALAFGACTAALVIVNLAMRAPDVVLSADGIDTGFSLLPWSVITSATRRNRFIGQTVHVLMEDGSERSFIVPERARADALAAELTRRKVAALAAPGDEESA